MLMLKPLLTFLLLSPLLMGFAKESSFNKNLFIQNGPYQQGSVLLNRTKLQTVVTWCSPTLLQMRVYENVNSTFPTNYTQLKGKDHPLQVSVTIFTPKLPFEYASNYGSPTLATSICSPANIQTTLTSAGSDGSISSVLTYGLGKPFQVKSNKPAVVAIDCETRKAGLLENWQYNQSHLGKTGGIVLIPAGETTTVSTECQQNSFSIKMY